jgi:hypothetical protein
VSGSGPVNGRALLRRTSTADSDVAQSPAPSSSGLEWKLFAIPILFVLLRIWGTIRTLDNDRAEDNSDLLFLCQAFFDPLQGFVNGILFVLCTGPVRVRFLHCMADALCRCRWDRALAAEGTRLTSRLSADSAASPGGLDRAGTNARTPMLDH